MNSIAAITNWFWTNVFTKWVNFSNLHPSSSEFKTAASPKKLRFIFGFYFLIKWRVPLLNTS